MGHAHLMVAIVLAILGLLIEGYIALYEKLTGKQFFAEADENWGYMQW